MKRNRGTLFQKHCQGLPLTQTSGKKRENTKKEGGKERAGRIRGKKCDQGRGEKGEKTDSGKEGLVMLQRGADSQL